MSIPTFRSDTSRTILGTKRTRPADPTDPEALKKKDAFLYYSQSKRRLDRVRFGAGDDDPDANDDVDDEAKRKTRLSVEVPLLNEDILRAVMRDL